MAALCWTAAVRLPFAGDVGEDELFFALVAQRWLAGLLPYSGSFDVKPPGLFALFAVAQGGFGTSITTVKGLEVGCVAVSSMGLWLTGTRYLSQPVGLFAAAIYPVYSLSLAGVNAPTELLQAPFEIFATAALLSAAQDRQARTRLLLAAGLLFGAAATVKQTAVFPALAVAAVTAWRLPGRRSGVFGWFALGAACVPLGFAALYAERGEFPALLDGAVFGAAGRLAGDDIGFGRGLLRFLPSMKPLIVLQIATLLMATRGLRLRGGPLAPVAATAVAWLAGEAAGIVALRSMYDHYFLALVPPLALIAGIVVCHLIAVGRDRAMWLLAALLAMAWPVAFDARGIAPGSDLAAAAAAARRIAELNLPPDAPVLVAGRGLAIYLYAGRAAAGRYFHPQHLLCDFPAPDADPLAAALAERPAALVVADADLGMVCERADRRAELRAEIAARYCAAGHVSGRFDAFDVWIRRADAAAGQSRAPCAPG